MSALDTPKEYRVDPARLASGTSCHTRDRQIGEGDIRASYSCDKIGLEGKVRKPFAWQNALWVCTGMRSMDASRYTEAYRFVRKRFLCRKRAATEGKTSCQSHHAFGLNPSLIANSGAVRGVQNVQRIQLGKLDRDCAARHQSTLENLDSLHEHAQS